MLSLRSIYIMEKVKHVEYFIASPDKKYAIYICFAFHFVLSKEVPLQYVNECYGLITIDFNCLHWHIETCFQRHIVCDIFFSGSSKQWILLHANIHYKWICLAISGWYCIPIDMPLQYLPYPFSGTTWVWLKGLWMYLCKCCLWWICN